MKKIIVIVFVLIAFISSNLPAMSHCGVGEVPCCCEPQQNETDSQESCCEEPAPLPCEEEPQNPNDGCQCSFESGDDFTPVDEIVLPSDNLDVFTALNGEPYGRIACKKAVKPQYSRGPPGKQIPLYIIHQQLLI